jgi:hypothetical protein
MQEFEIKVLCRLEMGMDVYPMSGQVTGIQLGLKFTPEIMLTVTVQASNQEEAEAQARLIIQGTGFNVQCWNVKVAETKIDRSLEEKLACKHTILLNRGCPPNTSNQRVCKYCQRTFNSPQHEGGGMLESNDSLPKIWVPDQ